MHTVFFAGNSSNTWLYTVYYNQLWPYIRWYLCQKYRIHTIYIWFWPTLYIQLWSIYKHRDGSCCPSWACSITIKTDDLVIYALTSTRQPPNFKPNTKPAAAAPLNELATAVVEQYQHPVFSIDMPWLNPTTTPAAGAPFSYDRSSGFRAIPAFCFLNGQSWINTSNHTCCRSSFLLRSQQRV